jgi:hypothetical protein
MEFNSKQLEEMLSSNLIKKVYDKCDNKDRKWMLIAGFDLNCQPKLKNIFGDLGFISSIDIFGDLNSLKTKIIASGKQCEITITKDELIKIVIIAIKHKIPVYDINVKNNNPDKLLLN